MDDAEAAARIGSVVDGRYKITGVIAAGSMGAVYQAERVPVGKLVAMKFLHASVANDSEFQARFEREIRVASKLAHPNCVAVLDFGVWEGSPYLVMEHVAGQTLRARMDKGPLPAAQALAFARQIAAGLAHAHEQGVIHRDIKPANVMITDEIGSGERVRILDFGLARLRGNVGRDATQTNMVVGTPNYMAPEQTVGGATIDARTDIYAVGVVLFEMVIGDRPFHAEDTLQLLGMHRAAPIPRLADRAKPGTEIPEGLQELIDKAMAKSPADRYQSAIELAEAIDGVIGSKRAATDTEQMIVDTGRTRQTGPTAMAPTMLDVDSSVEDVPGGRRGFWRGLVGLMILVGGGAAMAGYFIHRHAEQEAQATPKVVEVRDAAPAVAIDAEPKTAFVAPGSGSGSAQAIAPVAIDAADTGSAGSAEVPAPADAGIDAMLDDAGLPIIGPPDEVEMDPAKAVDLDPAAKGSGVQPEDEAADAPKNVEEVEKKPAPPQPQLATTLHDALELIQQGKRDLALASLRSLRKKNPKSAYIPFLLGNLYYDQRWWSVAMDDYADAIKKNAAYRTNATLNRNVIRMLSSNKTQTRAANFLKITIGRAAVPYLKQAAAHEDNPVVKKQAAVLARVIR